MSMNSIIINLRDFTQLYGVYVDTSLSFNKPAKNVETISIPGRSGDLVIDYGTFQNIVITFPCYIKDNFDTNYPALMNELAAMEGYQDIRISNDPTHKRYGVPIIQQSPTVRRLNKAGWFNLSFNCKPFRYLLSGDTSYTSYIYEISNPTPFNAYPAINVRGYGRIRLQNQEILAVPMDINIAQNNLGLIRIDCEAMTLFGEHGDPSPYVSIAGDYPYIAPGYTDVEIDNTFTSAALYPRWREL